MFTGDLMMSVSAKDKDDARNNEHHYRDFSFRRGIKQPQMEKRHGATILNTKRSKIHTVSINFNVSNDDSGISTHCNYSGTHTPS